MSSLQVFNDFSANQMSSFTTYSTLFDATGATFSTAKFTTSGSVTTSSFQVLNTIQATNSLNFNTPVVSVSTAIIQSLSTQSANTSSLYTVGASVGVPLNPVPNAPYMYGSTVSGLFPDTASEFITGQGTPYFPLRVVASLDRTVNGFITNPSNLSTYLNLSYIYRTDGLDYPGSTSIILGNPIVQSTILTLSSSTQQFQNYSLSNLLIDTKLISSTINYYLTGPETYASPSILQEQQILIAGGISTAPYKLAYSSDGGSTWTTLPFIGFENATNGIAWGYDKWIAVGNGITNTMLYSYTGTVWYNSVSPFSSQGTAVARGPRVFVATGSGTNSLAYSYDGISWKGAGTSTFLSGNGVATNGSYWIAVGQGTNTLAYSSIGISWTGLGTTVFSTRGLGVASSGSLWVAVGEGTYTLATSVNGISWTRQIVFTVAGRCVAWNGSMWVAGGSGTASIAYSADGLTWTPITTPLATVNSVVWTGTAWVALGQGTGVSAIRSIDGVAWTVLADTSFFTTGLCIASRTLPSFIQPASPTFLATGQGTTSLASSPDGTTWTLLTSPFTSSTNCVAYNGSIWIAGGSGTYALAYSTDGIAWTGVSFPNFLQAYSVAYGQNLWIAVGTGTSGYTRAQSVDGISWTQVSTGNFFSGTAYGITWAQAIWVATGTPESNGILFSVSGTTWVPQSVPVFSTGRCVASNGTHFLAGGQGTSTLAYSTEGSVWNTVGSGIFSKVSAVAWGSRLWVAVGQGTNTIAYSYDGVKWYGLGASIFSVEGNSVAWNGQTWVATGQGTNTLATSSDGITWLGRGASVFSVRGLGLGTSYPLQNTIINRQEPVGVRWNLSGVAQISPSCLEKPPRTTYGFDSFASSSDSYAASAFMQFKPHAPNIFCTVGLSENPAGPIHYAFYLTDAGLVSIYESGVLRASLGSYAPLDVFQIIFDGTTVYYLQNSVQVRSVARVIGNPLYFAASFNNPGSRIVDIEFHPQYQLSQTVPTSTYIYTTIYPSGFLSDPLVFKRTTTESVLPPALWQFQAPLSGSLSNLSSQVYGELLVGGARVFSTPVIQNPFLSTVSTYTFSYTLTSNFPVVPGNSMEFRIYTQRSLGLSQIFSTTLTDSIYNLACTQYVQLVHNSSNIGQQTSDLSAWTANVSTPQTNSVDPTGGIEMNSGFMRWNARQYGLSIQNQYNDMQLRSLTYTGNLYTASDSNLKHDTAYADTSELYEALRDLPLNRYALSDTYRTVFRTEDTHQLGVLTTEVAKRFPALIRPVESEHLGLSNLETVDRIQFRYAHLGATQHLMERVSTLSGRIQSLIAAGLKIEPHT